MTDFRSPLGFEEALRSPIDIRRARITTAVLRPPRGDGGDPSVRFARVARRAPEVMVKITGRTRDGAHLKAHLDYISRNGALALEGPDGEKLQGREGVRDLARGWAEEFAFEPGRRRASSITLSVILSMPAGTDAIRLHDAARAFAAETFGERFPYVFALHDEGRHPHVHLTVRRLGQDGERLNPRKADLQVWREGFARALRDRSIDAEATPRRTRGVTRKAERTPIRKMRERFVAGQGPLPEVLAVAYRAALMAGGGEAPWLDAIRRRELTIRRVLVAEAMRLSRSEKPRDRALAELVERFVRDRSTPMTREQVLRQRDEVQRDGGRLRDR